MNNTKYAVSETFTVDNVHVSAIRNAVNKTNDRFVENPIELKTRTVFNIGFDSVQDMNRFDEMTAFCFEESANETQSFWEKIKSFFK